MHTLNVSVGKARADIAIFDPEDARRYGVETWSLKSLQRQADTLDNALLADALSHNLYWLGIYKAFAPNVVSGSGCIAVPSDLEHRICLGRAVLNRKQEFPADGVFLERNQGFVMSSAGCPVILASAGGDFIAAHAGRDSLIDRGAVEGRPARKHVSVVGVILEKLRRNASSDIAMTMLLSIPARKFEHSADHPQHGVYNRKLATFVERHWPDSILREEGRTFLDLQQMFLEQARQAGIRHARATHSLDMYPNLAHTRDGKGADRRNLVIVKRDA